MSFPRDTYPYTNFHELNLGYFIVHFREIFSQWADLYDQMLNWKDSTDEELSTWKAGVEADLDQRETALRAELEAWKAQTGQDIAGWENATLAALTAWQTATQTVFEAIRVEAAGSATAAAASAGDAATAKTAAETAQAAAEAAAASIASSAAQIETNTGDIADLKTQLDYTESYTDITPAKATGGFNPTIGEVITFTDTSSWQRTSFVPEIGKQYRITITTRVNLSSANAYIATVDENNIVKKLYAIIPAQYATVENKSYTLTFDAEDKTVWVRSNKAQGGVLYVEEVNVETAIDRLSDDLSDLDESVDLINETVIGPVNDNIPVIEQDGGFNGDIGQTLEMTTSANWMRTSIIPEAGKKYHITVTIVGGLSNSFDYIKTTNNSNIVVANYANVADHATEEVKTFDVVFTDNDKIAWIRGKRGNSISVIMENTIYDSDISEINQKIEAADNSFNYNKDYYEAKIPVGASYNNSVYTEVYAAYDALCTEYPGFIERLTDLGNDSYGYPIAAYHLCKNKSIVGTLASWTIAGGDKNNQYSTYCPLKPVLLTSGVHGDEKSSVWGLFNFIKDYLSTDAVWANTLTNNVEFYIIPVVDPWGYNNNSRNNLNDVNINRDYLNANPCAEAQAVISMINTIKATKDIFVVMDCHTTGGSYGYISTKTTNPDLNNIMKIATDVIQKCASRWQEIATILGFDESKYPYEYGCLGQNVGTISDYCITNNITTNVTITEVIKVTGIKQSQISKMSSDLIGNLLLEYLK